MPVRDQIRVELQKNAIFREVPPETLDELSDLFEYKVIQAGTVIFEQGASGDSFCIIRSGRVRVFRKDAEGVETELTTMSSGECFGEMALLTGEPRAAYVEAVEETHLALLEKRHFDRVLKNNPEIALNFIKQISTWLVREDRKLEKETQRQHKATRLSWVDFVLIIGVSLLFGLVFNQVNPNGIRLVPEAVSLEGIETVSMATAAEEHDKAETIFVDAMPSVFYEQERIAGAVSLPQGLFDIMYMMSLMEEDKTRRIVVYGRTISRRYDEHVASKLALLGHKNIAILKGGVSAWKEKGYPVEP